MPSPEEKARENIDRLLTQTGWAVRNQSDANILAYSGVAIRNFSLKPRHGFVDYFSLMPRSQCKCILRSSLNKHVRSYRLH
jgi:hypothetical protein